MENHKDRGLGRWYLLGTVVVAVVLGLGTWGWLVAKPDIGVEEAFYRAIQLFVLEMPEEAYSIPLDIARWIAVGVAFIAVMQVLLTVLTQRRKLFDAKRRRNHVVVVGNGPLRDRKSVV